MLDYSLNARSPRVLWLQWDPNVPPAGERGGRYSQRNHWSQLAGTFDAFATQTGLINTGAA